MPIRRGVILGVALVSKVILHLFWYTVVLKRGQASEALDARGFGLARVGM